MTTPDPETTPQPKRKRRTSAEVEAERQAAAAEAAKPIDPIIWIILGALILFFAFWTWLDPVTFAEAGQPSSQSVFQLVPLLLIRFVGRIPAILILTVLGAIPLIWGIVGWLRKRFGKTET